MSGARRAQRLPGAMRALLVLALLLASATVGYVAHRLTAPRSMLTLAPAPIPALAPASAGAEGTFTESDGAPPAHKVPETLPDITLPASDGRPRQLTDWKGKPLLINFWATWCEPCRREIPLLVALRHQRAAEHLEVIGIAIDSPDAVHKYATTRGIDYPLLIGERGGLAAASAFGMDTVLPFSVFADSSGRIVTLKVGELHRDEAELILNHVRQLDSGTLTLAQARTQISQGMERLEGHEPAPPALPQ